MAHLPIPQDSAPYVTKYLASGNTIRQIPRGMSGYSSVPVERYWLEDDNNSSVVILTISPVVAV